MCPAVVPCATADEESGSSLKLGSCVDQPFVLIGTRELVLEIFSFKWTLHKILLFAKVNLNLILELSRALYSVYTPRGCGWTCWVRLYSPHFLIFQRKIQTLFQKTSSRVPSCTQSCLWIRVTRRRYRMAQDSDDPLFVVNIVVWVSVVILAIVALHCLLPRRVVRWWTIWCIKSVINLLGLILYHF